MCIRDRIEYDIPVIEKYLKDTYGITVYQEQVMLLSRLLADFTRGESDACLLYTSAYSASLFSSMPYCFSPIKLSPLSFSKILLYFAIPFAFYCLPQI